MLEIEVEDDGLKPDLSSMKAVELKGPGGGGLSVKFDFLMHETGSKIPVKVEVAYGDVVTPAAIDGAFPTLFEEPALIVPVIPWPTVVAEKFQAIVVGGMTNGRLKDVYDLARLSEAVAFEGQVLAEALSNTFRCRDTPIPKGLPTGLTPDYYESDEIRKQWNGFLGKYQQPLALALKDEVEKIAAFVMPIVQALEAGSSLDVSWPAGGPWS